MKHRSTYHRAPKWVQRATILFGVLSFLMYLAMLYSLAMSV